MADIPLAPAGPITFTEFWTSAEFVLFLVAGISVYAFFIFKFYRFLAKRDLLTLKKEEYYQAYEGLIEKFLRLFFYVLENLVLIPLFVAFWFAVLASFLVILSNNMDLYFIILVSAGFVASVRLCAYYDESLAQDLAKLVPLSLIVVFLTDIHTVSLSGYLAAARDIPSHWRYFAYCLIVVTSIEFVLRITHAIVNSFARRRDAPTP